MQAKAAADVKAWGQQLSFWEAMVGNEAGAFAAMASNALAWRGDRPAPVAKIDPAGARAVDALKAIVEASRGRRLVILNEAHHVSRCRAFGVAVAVALRAEGFTWLAAEAFSPYGPDRFADTANAGKPMLTSSGYYHLDPVFAEFVRQAREAGYRLADYEQRQEQEAPEGSDGAERIAAREEAQAANLIANVLEKDPKARVLVYCGYSHAAKIPLGGQPWMAARLKAKTGLDPLCIEQSNGAPDPAGADLNPNLPVVLDHFAPSGPVAVFSADGAALTANYPGAVDIAVYHPRLAAVDGRPGWLPIAPGRRRAAFVLPEPLAPGALLQAIPAAEAALAQNVIPADQYLITAPARTATFFLRPGDYRLLAETDAGRLALGSLRVA